MGQYLIATFACRGPDQEKNHVSQLTNPSPLTSRSPSTHEIHAAHLEHRRRPAWRERLVQAERGLVRGIRSDSAFFVHFFGIVIVIAAALVLRIGWMQWVAIAGCLTLVLTAEMFNQALKTLARSGSGQSQSTQSAVSDSAMSQPVLALSRSAEPGSPRPGGDELSPEVQRALAIGTAAVLVACTGSTVVLTIVFWQRFDQLF